MVFRLALTRPSSQFASLSKFINETARLNELQQRGEACSIGRLGQTPF